jgi:putative aminopeptidase FrvX
MSQIKIKNRIDHKMLTATLAVQTTSGDDDAMIVYIREQLKFLDVTVQEDGYGNIYVTKGTSKSYPCVIAHTDTVQAIINLMEIYKTGDTLFAFDPSKRHQHGIGGDDKVGVYILLQLLTDLPSMKAVFFREEEVGCRGSHYAIQNHKEWFKDCGYVIGADRRGNSDIITVSGNLLITSDDYLDTMEKIHERYNYTECIGILSDVDTLIANDIGVSCVNYSCGYHEPHSSKETVSISDVNRCYNLIYDILTEFPEKRFEYIAPIPAYKKYSSKYNKKGVNSGNYSSMSELVGPHSPVKPRQEKFFPPLFIGPKYLEYDNFREIDILKNDKKIYSYIGIKAVVFTNDTKCDICNTEITGNFFFLPFEGRIYCTKCNDYVDENKVPAYLQFLEIEDKGEVFVHSLYANGWLLKKHALWNDKLKSWVPDEMPF